MKATMNFAQSATVAGAFMERCNSCRGSGGVYVDEDLQIQFEVCLKCDGYGVIHAKGAE